MDTGREAEALSIDRVGKRKFGKMPSQPTGNAQAPKKAAVVWTVLLLTEGVMMDLCSMSQVVGWYLN